MDSQPVRDDESRGGEDSELLREIREDFTYFRDFWRENHEEWKTDLRFVSGDPWDADAREEREDNGRPVLSPDELGQYLNAAINNLRQNKRAIKVNPTGSGATDKDADRRSAIIKGIEYKSNAQSAYTNAFENAINCGMGFFRVTTKIVGKDDDVNPWIKIIENPLSVLLDPNAKEADFCDQKRCFVMDVLRQRDFAKKYPKAQKRSFEAEDMKIAPDWFSSENILVAEYWRIDDYDENGNDGKVTQYITNGLEILEENEWPGSWIPIIAVTGKKMLVPMGSQIKIFYASMIRLARGPQKMLAYIASQEAEEFGMAPRAPFVGYVGQFETDKDAWTTLNKVPRSFVQVDATTDEATGQLLPPPSRPAFIPNAQAYEIAKESWRRSIQASMGITPLPTAAQRQNEKSGIALDKIQSQQAIGSFHFTDNFDRAIENAGRQVNELITLVMDTPRQIGVRQPDDTHDMMHIAPRGQGAPADVKQEDVFDPTKGEFDVTISSGMSYQSQRQEASDFVDLLVQEMPNLPISPQQKASLLSKAISLKDIGPIGDDIAKLIDPQGDGELVPPQAQAMIQQLQQEAQALHAACEQYKQKLAEMQFQKDAKVVDNESRMLIEKMKIEAQVAVAEINTKAQRLDERLEFVNDMIKQLHAQSHEAALAQQQHQQGLETQQQAADLQPTQASE